MAPVVSCPAFYEAERSWNTETRLDARRALFLLDGSHRLIAAYHQARSLDASQAQALWHQHPWQPVAPGQPWPVPSAPPEQQQRDW